LGGRIQAGPVEQDHRVVVGGSLGRHVDDEALAASPVQVEDLVGQRERADDRVPEDLLAVPGPANLVASP
jgi:hypothetical protein